LANIFVVNKGDLPGANKSASEITASLELNNFTTDWRPTGSGAVAETGQGVSIKFWMLAVGIECFLKNQAC